MNTIIIIIVVVVLAIGGIAVANWVQAREREEAERRHKVAVHRGAIREAQELLEFGQFLPLDASVRNVLLDFILLNAQTIRQIDSSSEVGELMNWAEALRRQPVEPEGERPLQLPSQSEELTGLRTKIHRLTEYVARMRRNPALDAAKVLLAFKYLARLRLRCDVEGHVKLGQIAMLGEKPELARQYYKYAYDRLVKENISDSYVQEQLSVLEEVMKEIRAATEAQQPQEEPAHQPPQPEFDPTFQQKKKW
jgi:hypothetical protein